MKKVILACVVAASLAGCSWTHHRNNATEGSGSSTPPAQQQSQYQPPPQNMQPAPSAPKTNWNDCAEHPYSPSPRHCD